MPLKHLLLIPSNSLKAYCGFGVGVGPAGGCVAGCDCGAPVLTGLLTGAVFEGIELLGEVVPDAGVDGTLVFGAFTLPLADPETPGVTGACVLAGGGLELTCPLAPTLPVLLIPGVPFGSDTPLVSGVMLRPIEEPLTTSSTRRFICRPAAVALVATGFSRPKPFVFTLLEVTPCDTRNS